MSKAFDGVTVLDLSQVLAGPSCGMQLALLGANIIKIEPPSGGDQMRNRVLGSQFSDIGMAAAFLGMNIGKRSLGLDIKSEKGKEILFALIKKSDVILHNFRAGVVDRLGLDYDNVRAINPSIVYTVISGFGAKGPRSADPAYDGAVQAAAGMMANNGTAESGPLRTGYMPVDLMTGMTAAYATTAALLRKQKTGKGQMVDVAMLDCAITLGSANFSRSEVDDIPDMLIGNQSIAGAPTASSFPTAEGSILTAAIMPKHVEAFFDELGLREMVNDPKFATPEARIENKEIVRDAMIEALKSDTAENWEKRLAPRGVPVAKINSVKETASLEQLQYRNILTAVPAAKGMANGYKLPGAPFTNSEDGPEVMRPAPVLGQHTVEILEEIGIDKSAISTLAAEGVICKAD
ncbi:MAG: CoA transferase [Rhodospirillaceae bacterium]|nr:CoA transferase [Rhodospirillaceae bacterium]OUU18853.1 MAG: hypothetical protein CBB97_20575 [Candidatus Endolissoclinum sp. TMED37]|tara:strand:- start:52 stop:1269 length:1218 start_codon:yes stop_codon:yes gene_type:complete